MTINLFEAFYRATKDAPQPFVIAAYQKELAVLNGIVKDVYEIDGWQEDSRHETGRFEFYGKEAPQDIKEMFINKKIPEGYRKKGMASPVLYHD